MLLKTLFSCVPFVTAFKSFPAWAHKSAFPKFLCLWIASVFPLLLAASLHSGTKDLSQFQNFLNELSNQFFGTHQFIFAVSFITPVLYLWYEYFDQMTQFIRSNKRKAEGSFKQAPEGVVYVIVSAILVWLFTALAYATDPSVGTDGGPTMLQRMAGSGLAVGLVYLFSLMCWYLTIIDTVPPPVDGFQIEKKNSERSLADQFNNRISGTE